MKTDQLLKKIKALARSRRFQLIAAGALAVFVVLNLAVFSYYHGKTLPRTTINGQSFGSTDFSQFGAKLKKSDVLPARVKLSYKNKKTDIKTSDLGFSLDTAKIEAYSRGHRSWLPLVNVLKSHNTPSFVKVDGTEYNKAFAKLNETYKQDPVNARIVLEKDNFKLVSETNGYKLLEARTKSDLAATLAHGDDKLVLPAAAISPQVKKQKLEANLRDLQKQLKTSVIFRYQSKSYKLTPQDMAGLFAQNGDAYVLSDARIRPKIVSIGASFGIRIQNINEAVASTKQSVSRGEAEDFSLVAVTISRSYTYCVQLKGVDPAQQAAFESKIRSTLADNRGWSLGGQVSFTQVGSGCNMRIWLAAAADVPGFGAICDNMWSCTVSPNVIINYDRWSNASDSWNAAGGSLEDYRSMVINHEVGHWLGFGHKYCGGAGQAAPVMQQQSIDLQGCTFNPWPLPSETATLRGWYGI
jgi:hypothetical protein